MPKDEQKGYAVVLDRAAILLVVAKMRYGNDWNPFLKDALYDDEGSLGDEIRSWPEYREALSVIEMWMRREEKKWEPCDEFTPPWCRGSVALGTACGSCDKCKWERGEWPAKAP
jgi:hypothetical protein